MSHTLPEFRGTSETYRSHSNCPYHPPSRSDIEPLPPCNVFYYLATKSQKLVDSSFLNLVQSLLDASLLGELDKVKQLHSNALAKGWPIPLQLMAVAATERGRATTVQYCLDRGAEIDSDLDIASIRGASPELYAVLVKAGWPRAPRTISNVLHSNLRKGEPVVRFLLDQGAQFGPGTLSLAATGCDIATLDLLVSRGCQIQDSGALQTAALANNLANVKWLLENGARINEIPKYDPGDERDCTNGTALHRAIAGNAVDVIKYLLEQGADTQIRDQQDMTPMEVVQNYPIRRADEIIDILKSATTKL